MYNKLFSKIVRSSIWLEPDGTRIVWFMFIALMDEDGFVQFASVANIAHTARIELVSAEEAIKILEGPDANSADPDNEGRRIEKVPGGWMVLNSSKYRDLVTRDMIRQQTRERVKRHRQKHSPVTQCNAQLRKRNAKLTPSDTDTDTKGVGSNGSSPASVEDWLKELESDKTYQGISVRTEYGKMLNWCKVHGKQATKRRFVNWLNHTDKPLPKQHAARVDYKRNHSTAPTAPEVTEEERARLLKIAAEAKKRLKESFHNNVTFDPKHAFTTDFSKESE